MEYSPSEFNVRVLFSCESKGADSDVGFRDFNLGSVTPSRGLNVSENITSAACASSTATGTTEDLPEFVSIVHHVHSSLESNLDIFIRLIAAFSEPLFEEFLAVRSIPVTIGLPDVGFDIPHGLPNLVILLSGALVILLKIFRLLVVVFDLLHACTIASLLGVTRSGGATVST